MNTQEEAQGFLNAAMPMIHQECSSILGGELHYQAMLYHALRTAGVPLAQIGMNVRQWVKAPKTELFQANAKIKKDGYTTGFETIPDIVLFRPEIQGDWRRRNRENTLRAMLMAIEVKVSERSGTRLRRSEIAKDILKIAAHRREVQHLGADFLPVMMVIDVAPLQAERMLVEVREQCKQLAADHGIAWRYLCPITQPTELA